MELDRAVLDDGMDSRRDFQLPDCLGLRAVCIGILSSQDDDHFGCILMYRCGFLRIGKMAMISPVSRASDHMLAV